MDFYSLSLFFFFLVLSVFSFCKQQSYHPQSVPTAGTDKHVAAFDYYNGPTCWSFYMDNFCCCWWRWVHQLIFAAPVKAPTSFFLLWSSMFWLDGGQGGRSTLEKSWMDGSDRGTLVILTAQQAHGLTADTAAQRLYWISDFKRVSLCKKWPWDQWWTTSPLLSSLLSTEVVPWRFKTKAHKKKNSTKVFSFSNTRWTTDIHAVQPNATLSLDRKMLNSAI